ncbi:MAG: RNA-processing protein [Euryarchaeota archaeon RBG_13_57_23]|nr:MAG: RNA-processing protein [Euryarchaeota archaeon RBG_13_57_23]
MQSIKIPTDRVGALIGKGGSVKQKLEERTGVKITIDSEEGDVQVDHTHSEDPSMALAVLNVVHAIGRGFSPTKAFLLLDDDYFLKIFDIRDYVGKRQESVVRMRARVIGSRGKTRTLVEELTGAFVSVYGNTVALIGNTLQIDIASRALDMLLSGSEHAAVYNFLEGRRGQLKVDGMGF